MITEKPSEAYDTTPPSRQPSSKPELVSSHVSDLSDSVSEHSHSSDKKSQQLRDYPNEVHISGDVNSPINVNSS